MTKFLLGIAIVAFTSFCGYLLTKKYRKRKSFFKQLYEFNERFINEISYYRRSLSTFIAQYVYRGEFQGLLEAIFNLQQERTDVLQTTLQLSEYNFLKEEEKRIIIDYFSMLGKGDSQSQKNYFSGQKERLTKMKNEAEETCKKYGDLYVKLAFLCGLLILILII